MTETKTLFVNDEERALPINFNLQEALTHWQLTENSFAIAINEQFIPKTQYPVTPLNRGDRIELLVPMQGG